MAVWPNQERERHKFRVRTEERARLKENRTASETGKSLAATPHGLAPPRLRTRLPTPGAGVRIAAIAEGAPLGLVVLVGCAAIVLSRPSPAAPSRGSRPRITPPPPGSPPQARPTLIALGGDEIRSRKRSARQAVASEKENENQRWTKAREVRKRRATGGGAAARKAGGEAEG